MRVITGGMEKCPIPNVCTESACYEAYFGKNIDVEAENLNEACRCAMARADDDFCKWKDTLVSSPHWVESFDYDPDVVPEECGAAAIRCGGAVVIAYRLREALRSLVSACERDRGALGAIDSDLEFAKTVLKEVPERIGD
jgi:hypothetical protein